MKKKLIAILLLLLIPALLTLYRLNVDKPHYSSDPDYAYMMNGLNICIFQLPFYSDHPGVPLTIFNAVFLYPVYLFSGHGNGLQFDFFSNPVYYELRLHNILFVIVLISSFIFGYILWRKTGNIGLALVLQGIPFYYFISVDVIATRNMPETIFPVIFLAFIVDVVYLIVNPAHRKALMLLPILSGFALSVKIILFPFLLIPLFLYCKSYKDFIYFCLNTVLSFIVFTLPIIKQFPHMAYWFFKLFIHSGYYGHGAFSIINPNSYFSNIKSIITSNQLLLYCFIISVAFAIVLPFIRKKFHDFLSQNLTRLFYVVFFTHLINLLILAKSFDIGKDYYLITYSVLDFSCIIFILIGIGKYLSSGLRNIFAFSFILIVLAINFNKYIEWLKGWEMTKHEMLEVDNFIADHSNSFFVYNNGYSLNKMNSLLFGQAFSKIHAKMLKSVYPDALFFNLISGEFSDWSMVKDIKPVLISKPTFLIDSELDNDEINKLNLLGITPVEVFSNRSKIIYQIQLDSKVNARDSLK